MHFSVIPARSDRWRADGERNFRFICIRRASSNQVFIVRECRGEGLLVSGCGLEWVDECLMLCAGDQSV